MKKAISLLLVLAVAIGMSAVAFAATDYPDAGALNATGIDTGSGAGAGAGGRNATGIDTGIGAGTRAGTRAGTDPDTVYLDETGPATFSIRTDTASPGVTTVTVPTNELYLVDKNNVVVGTEDVLLPNETYKFDVYYNNTGNPLSGSDSQVVSGGHRLTKGDLGSTGTVKFRTVRGSSSIQSTKVRTRGSGASQTFYIEITTRNVYGTKLNDVEYDLSATVSGTPVGTATMLPAPPTTSVNYFKVGFMTISDDQTDVGEEGTIVIYREAPVILKDQFADIARSANYKNVIFEGEEGTWSFRGKVAGMKDSNFYYDFDPDTDLLNKFPEHEFKFLTFRAGVNFPTTGEMRIDVSDVSDDFNTMYAYLYREGKLTEINGTYDSATDELVFRTNYLGRFVISNRAITDTSLVPEPEPDEEVPAEPYPPTTTNPNTGAPASANVMVALGFVSLASAAVVGRKRK